MLAGQNSKWSQFSGILKESKHHPSRKSFFITMLGDNIHGPQQYAFPLKQLISAFALDEI